MDEAAVRQLSMHGNALFPPARVLAAAVSPNGGRIHFAQTETKAPGIAAVREQLRMPPARLSSPHCLWQLHHRVLNPCVSWYCRLGNDGHGPAYTPGIRLELWPDDQSEDWQETYERAMVAPVRDVGATQRKL